MSNWRLRGLYSWVRPVEECLGRHPDGAGLLGISWDTGASPATIHHILAWLDQQGRLETLGDPPRYRLRTGQPEPGERHG